jgi:hypothetical protein
MDALHTFAVDFTLVLDMLRPRALVCRRRVWIEPCLSGYHHTSSATPFFETRDAIDEFPIGSDVSWFTATRRSTIADEYTAAKFGHRDFVHVARAGLSCDAKATAHAKIARRHARLRLGVEDERILPWTELVPHVRPIIEPHDE